MRTSVLPAVLTAILLDHAGAEGRVWSIEFDPSHEESAVGSVVEMASSRDTVLIGPGHYYEHIDLDGKSLRIAGTGGAALTVIDGSRTPPEGLGGIIAQFGIGSGVLEIEGLTLQGGQGATRGFYGQPRGGAILFSGERFAARDCVFRDNAAEFGLSGGIYLSSVGSALLEDCSFEDNRDGDVVVWGQSLVVRRCRVVSPEASVAAQGVWEGTVEECLFRRSAPGGGLALSGLNISVIKCRFEECPMWLAEMPEPYEPRPGSTRIEDNTIVFHSHPSGVNARVQIGQGGSIDMIGNTLVRAPLFASNGHSGRLELSENIFCESSLSLYSSDAEIRCNDIYPDSVTTIGPFDYPMESNISADPRFCAPESNDFRVSSEGPCGSTRARWSGRACWHPLSARVCYTSCGGTARSGSKPMTRSKAEGGDTAYEAAMRDWRDAWDGFAGRMAERVFGSLPAQLPPYDPGDTVRREAQRRADAAWTAYERRREHDRTR
jgi:hypothetical protein